MEDPLSKKIKQNNGELPKYHIKNNHEGIVTRETWNAVQAEAMRRSNKQKTSEKAISGRGKYNGKLALSEILVCTLKGINLCCGSPYMRKTWKKRSGEKQTVWRCKGQVHDKKCPNSVNIDEKSLQEGIVETLFSDQPKNNILQFPLLHKIEVAFENEMNTKFNIAEAEEKIENLKQRAIAMVSECAANNSLHLNQDQIKALSDEAKALQIQVDEEKRKNLQPEQKEKVDEKMKIVTKHLSSYTDGYPREYDDELVRQAIHKIKVIDSDCIQIVFNNGTSIMQNIVAKIRKQVAV